MAALAARGFRRSLGTGKSLSFVSPTMRPLVLVALGMLFGTLSLHAMAGVELNIGRIADTEAIADDQNCSFPASYVETGKPAPQIVSANLLCSVWANVDGKDINLRSENFADCERGWILPREGSSFSRVYRGVGIKLRAHYRAVKVCWKAERCEYVRLKGRFEFSGAGKARTLSAEGMCAW